MCSFFSFVTDGKTDRYFFDADKRKELKKSNFELDSHASICKYFNLKEDNCNKYEYNPLTQKFIVDQINNKHDDSKLAEQWVEKLDFKTIIPELVIKPILYPFNINPPELNMSHILLLKQWDLIRDSVQGPIENSVLGSVRKSLLDSIGELVADSIWGSVWDSVWISIRKSIQKSIRDSVWDSVWDAAQSYFGSFVIINKWKYVKHIPGIYPFQCVVDLWEQGILPLFNGKEWQLHTKNGIILHITKEELKKN